MPTTRFKSRTPLFLIGLALGLVAALAAWFWTGTTYTAEASLQVFPLSATPTDENDPTDQLSMRTEARVADSDELVAAVAAKHGMSTSEVQRGLQVTNPNDTTVLNFTYTSDDPAEAAEMANAVADAYLVARAQHSEESIGNIRKSLDTQLAELRTRFDDVAGDLSKASAARRPIYEAQLTAITEQTIAVTTELARITSLLVTPGAKLATPSAPESPSSPSPFVWIALGLAGGAVLGGLLIWLSSLRDGKPAADQDQGAAAPAASGSAGSGRSGPTFDAAQGEGDSSATLLSR